MPRESSWFSHAPKTRAAAQLAAMLVRVDVVGVVRARAVVAEVADRPPVGEAADDRAVLAVGQPRRAAQHLVDVARAQAAALAGQRVHIVAFSEITSVAGSTSTR